MDFKFVAVSGKKGSGKSTLSDMLTVRGWERISFADYLKDLTCRLFCWPKEFVTDGALKQTPLEEPVFFDWQQMHFIEKENPGLIVKNPSTRQFFTPREALQYIGTDVLRDADENFHVNKFRSELRGRTGMFVSDDVRFPNELDAVKGFNALCVYVARPDLLSTDSHPSEVSLSADDFENVIVNDGTLADLQDKFEVLLRSRGMIE